MNPPWLVYEVAAKSMLECIREHLNLGKVQGRSIVPGKSGTDWEIDACAFDQDGDEFFIVEVRRYTNSQLKQEHMAAIAYRVCDVGAKGGITISPLPCQSGAKLVARAAGIRHIQLASNSTAASFVAEMDELRFIGETVLEAVNAADTVSAKVIPAPTSAA